MVESMNEIINSKEIAREINDIVNTKIIYIFGSYAKGTQKKIVI